MEKALQKKVIRISTETAIILLTVASAVLLPQILHGFGILLGVGGQLGQMLLPMYLPVLIIGAYRGSVSGAIVGVLSPIVSFAITGMPAQALLPYITLELIATGLLIGMRPLSKLPAILRVLAVQALAKLVRLSAYAIALYSATGSVSASALLAGVLLSLPGVAIQLALVSYLIAKKERTSNG